ncbi:unnamed protein product [Adineta ricciae]|uniref:G-protein coupled receptors family 1 profile domain-containing protein n=1 Tax=Adineta ricciae TaxID=249248 RepID=A0A814VU69_ADIRI|nr:unnamed protein product [Adineta ricciae]CAF1624171.1 unnamed protein product [Adineta ricciae]
MDADIISLLNNISFQLNRYFASTIFLFGFIGNILNTLVLLQHPLRSNPCSFLFLTSSISYLISLCSGVISRILSTWNADMTGTNQILCKLRIFIYFNTLTISLWLITLATVDRWCSSSINASYRRRSTLKNAQRNVILIIIISSILQIQHSYCYEANRTDTPLKCYNQSILCGILSDLSFALITVLVPLTLMLIFGLMIISNIRQTQTLIRPIAARSEVDSHRIPNSISIGRRYVKNERKTNRQLLLMLSVQILIIFLCMFPFALSKLYSTFTRDLSRSTLQSTIENFIFNLLLLFSNVPSGLPFYIYTLTGGKVFRKALINIFRK